MQQLLQITSIPIELKYEMEPSRLQYHQSPNPQADILQRPARLNLRSQNIQVRLDTLDMRRSLGFQTNDDRAKDGAQKGRDNIQDFIQSQEQYGRQVSQIQDGVTIGQIFRQKVKEMPSSYTVFLPSVGPRISWKPNELNVQYQGGKLALDWNVHRNIMEFVPGKFQLNITQYPRVEIEYVGDPNYIPPSSDPNYEEVAE